MFGKREMPQILVSQAEDATPDYFPAGSIGLKVKQQGRTVSSESVFYTQSHKQSLYGRNSNNKSYSGSNSSLDSNSDSLYASQKKCHCSSMPNLQYDRSRSPSPDLRAFFGALKKGMNSPVIGRKMEPPKELRREPFKRECCSGSVNKCHCRSPTSSPRLARRT